MGCPSVTSWLIAMGIFQIAGRSIIRCWKPCKATIGICFSKNHIFFGYRGVVPPWDRWFKPPSRCCRNWSSNVFQGLGLDQTTSLMPSRAKQHYKIIKHRHTSSLGSQDLNDKAPKPTRWINIGQCHLAKICLHWYPIFTIGAVQGTPNAGRPATNRTWMCIPS